MTAQFAENESAHDDLCEQQGEVTRARNEARESDQDWMLGPHTTGRLTPCGRSGAVGPPHAGLDERSCPQERCSHGA
jgi:hypothetical protein